MLMTESQLKDFGYGLGGQLDAGAVVALCGDLGTGKTTLASAIAAGLGVTETVSSPSFTLIKEYRTGRLPLYHFDVYRIGGETACVEMEDLGYEEYFYGDGICIVEWADLVSDLLPDDCLQIELFYADNPELRDMKISNNNYLHENSDS